MPSTIFSIAVFFEPEDNVLRAILTHLRAAAKTIDIAAYALTEDEMVDLLCRKREEGLTVNVLLDRSQSTGKAAKPVIEKLIEAGINVVIGTSREHSLLHDKSVVIDGVVTITGSYNFSESAAKQGNTCLIIRSQDIAERYIQHINLARAWCLEHQPEYQPTAKN